MADKPIDAKSDVASNGAPGEPIAAFADVPERSAADHMLRIVQQHHVQLSAMADTKASIVITCASIVLTLALGRLDDPQIGSAMLVLAIFTLLSLLLAVLAVLPKYRTLRRVDDSLPSGFNLLFFGHFVALDESRYLAEMAKAMAVHRPYEMIVRDVYGIGSYLAHHKYPYLRLSYVFLLVGFLSASAVEVFQVIIH